MKTKRFFPFAIAVVIVGMFGGTLWFLWAKSRPKPLELVTEKPVVTDIVRKVVASGTIEARREIEIKPRISGILRKLTVEPGQLVKSGDVMGEVQVIPDVVSLNEAELRERSGKLAVERAKRELDRAVKLGASGAAATGELDKLRSDYELAVEELKGAEARVRLVREGAASKVRGAGASTYVESTVTGTVLTVPVKEGSSVINANSFNAGTTVAVVADMTDMIFKGRVDESEVGKLRSGMPVEIVVGALEDTKFVGTLEHIAPKSQVKDGTTEFEIEAAFRPPRGRGGARGLQRQRQHRARSPPAGAGHQREPAHLRQGPSLRRGGGGAHPLRAARGAAGALGRGAGRGDLGGREGQRPPQARPGHLGSHRSDSELAHRCPGSGEGDPESPAGAERAGSRGHRIRRTRGRPPVSGRPAPSCAGAAPRALRPARPDSGRGCAALPPGRRGAPAGGRARPRGRAATRAPAPWAS